MSVQRSQSSIERGKTAGYVVRVSTKNGSASGVSVTLTSQPATQKPTFTSGCAKGDGTASCTVGSVTAKKPVVLHARIAVASNANSVNSVKLTATASIAATPKWTPPAAAETTAVTSASITHAAATPAITQLPVLPIGPVPNLKSEASTLIGAGSASGLFPVITPTAKPHPAATNHPRPSSKGDAEPTSNSTTPVQVGTTANTAQVAGLIALGLAIILTVTRLSLRRRSGSGGQRG